MGRRLGGGVGMAALGGGGGEDGGVGAGVRVGEYDDCESVRLSPKNWYFV